MDGNVCVAGWCVCGKIGKTKTRTRFHENLVLVIFYWRDKCPMRMLLRQGVGVKIIGAVGGVEDKILGTALYAGGHGVAALLYGG